jgi:hypothetical protein
MLYKLTTCLFPIQKYIIFFRYGNQGNLGWQGNMKGQGNAYNRNQQQGSYGGYQGGYNQGGSNLSTFINSS